MGGKKSLLAVVYREEQTEVETWCVWVLGRVGFGTGGVRC